MNYLRALTFLLALSGLAFAAPAGVRAQAGPGPLRIVITDGVIEPMPFAIPDFIVENTAAAKYASRIARVVAADLQGTGLFREIPNDAYISTVTNFDSPVQYADWKAINAQALITGAVRVGGSGRLTVKFRLYDVFSGVPLGKGLQFGGPADTWRRMGHKVADAVYTRITGEGPYFDSRVAYIAESGPKNARRKRLAIMDYDGANVRYLTDGRSIVLSPRFSPTGDRLLYTSYASGFPRVTLLNLASGRRRVLDDQPGIMSFAPRFAPDGKTVLLSLSTGGNTDIFKLSLASGQLSRLTAAPSIEIAPSYSPDGRSIVFTSDRSGTSQLYIMPANGGAARRISAGAGRYNTPVWSPRGDLIAFTKQLKGRFHIGVMRIDGSEERLLTSSFLDEGPTWSPNGRVIMFARETAGENGTSSLYTVDISGRNLRKVATDGNASDPAWSPELK